MIKKLHEIGYVHLDIKPDNILIETSDFTCPRSLLVSLIDFSASRKFVDPITGIHIKKIHKDFVGNIAFSSSQQMLGNGK